MTRRRYTAEATPEQRAAVLAALPQVDPYVPDWVNTARRLRRAGLTYTAIAAAVGKRPATVSAWLKKPTATTQKEN